MYKVKYNTTTKHNVIFFVMFVDYGMWRQELQYGASDHSQWVRDI